MLYPGVEYAAHVMHDWTTLELADGRCFAFNRSTGRVYKIPDPACPFIINPWQSVDTSRPDPHNQTP